jgi:ApbE superfamily uncharacterized protein (UPF0280 family)
MKTSKYQRRFYREWVRAEDLRSLRVGVKETDVQVLIDKPIDAGFIRGRIQKYRGDIENYIARDRRFLTGLKPIAVERTAPPIVKAMGEAAKKADVGPMAAVAGAIAAFLGRDLLKRGCKDVIVENGGDIFLKSSKVRTIGIYAGRSKAWQGLSLKIKPKDTPLGICASSGTIGHSLSFGVADCTVVLAKDAALADAVATATGNRVASGRDLHNAIAFARSIRGIRAAVVILKNKIISWGEVEFAQ